MKYLHSGSNGCLTFISFGGGLFFLDLPNWVKGIFFSRPDWQACFWRVWTYWDALISRDRHSIVARQKTNISNPWRPRVFQDQVSFWALHLRPHLYTMLVVCHCCIKWPQMYKTRAIVFFYTLESEDSEKGPTKSDGWSSSWGTSDRSVVSLTFPSPSGPFHLQGQQGMGESLPGYTSMTSSFLPLSHT